MEFKIDITEQVKRLDGLFKISIRVFIAEDVIGEAWIYPDSQVETEALMGRIEAACMDSAPPATALAYGLTIESAVLTFAALQWPGEGCEFGALEEGPGDAFSQRLRVDGTSVKVDGEKVPGGYVVTEWA